MATPNFVFPPGVTVPRSLVPISAPSSTLTDVESFLMSQCRLAHDVLPDGNCMFRALSHQIYGSDQHHVHVRSMLLEVIESNKIIYQPYWIEDTPWGKTTFNEHLQKLALVGSWGTQVELQAVSDCFNVTVFVCSPNPSGIVRWEKKATPKNHDNINILLGVFKLHSRSPTIILNFVTVIITTKAFYLGKRAHSSCLPLSFQGVVTR